MSLIVVCASPLITMANSFLYWSCLAFCQKKKNNNETTKPSLILLLKSLRVKFSQINTLQTPHSYCSCCCSYSCCFYCFYIIFGQTKGFKCFPFYCCYLSIRFPFLSSLPLSLSLPLSRSLCIHFIIIFSCA